MREYLFQAVFYLSALLTILGASAVVLQKNPVRAVLSLVFCFFMVAIIWMMSNAEFLSLVLVLVYVGAVMTLFLFVVMMINVDEDAAAMFPKIYYVGAMAFMMSLLALLAYVMPKDLTLNLAQNTSNVVKMTTESLGQLLYIDYIAILEMTALLLLVAIVAAITLVHRGPRNIKRQKIKHQIMVRKSNRLKIIKMSTVKK